MLRRLLLVLVASGALMLSLGIGFLAADWPFLHRIWQLESDGTAGRVLAELPVATIAGATSGAFFPLAGPGERTLDDETLAQAAAWAEANGSAALLVLHRGRLQFERYWHGLARESPYPALGLSRSLLAIAYGRALLEGRISSLDASIDQWIGEWRGEPRGAITLRQLLWNVSGLEQPAPDNWRARLGKSGRLRYGTETVRAALSFGLAHEPGTHFALSRVDAQLLGIVLERASGARYAQVIEHSFWDAIGAGAAQVRVDRPGGMAAVFDGVRAAPGDLLRLGALLAGDDGAGGGALLPKDWTREMAQGSVPNPRHGLEAWGLGDGGLLMAADGRALWVWPGEQLVVLRLGPAAPGWDPAALPRILRRGLP